jgi:glycosyltransferase involved in cell wall biosynthesis
VTSQVRLIPNCTPLRDCELVDCGSKPVRIAYVGRIKNADKNVFVLPEIAAVLESAGLEFVISILGDGPDLPELKQRCERLSVDRKVAFLGRRTREEVGDLLSESHFVLIPSVYEGLSNVMLEAMAVGCVPVVSDFAGFRWVLGEAAEDLRAKSGAPAEYGACMMRLLDQPDLFRSIQRRLRERQRELFAPEATVNAYNNLLAEAAQSRDASEFVTIPFRTLNLPAPYRLQCSLAWRVLQLAKGAVQ